MSMNGGENVIRQPPWPAGEGEMAGLIRDFDWSSTALGPATTWPGELRSAIGMMLDLGFPSYVWWGSDFIQFYNDAAIALNRARHPGMLGRGAEFGWADSWPTVGGFAARVVSGGKPLLGEDLAVSLDDGGPAEHNWFALSYNPLRDEAGRIAGIFVTATETTARVQAERERVAAADRLRESEERYRTIFTSSGEGIAFCEALFDQSGKPVAYRVLDANPAYKRMRGDAAGQANELLGLLPRVLIDNETVSIEQTAVDPERRFSTQIIPATGSGHGRFIIVSSDDTAQLRAQLVVRRSQERQSFLLALSDAMRPLAEPVQIAAVAARFLARHLGASRVAYGQVAGDRMTIAADYAESVASIAGSWPLPDFGEAEVAAWRRGNTVVAPDIAKATELSEAERQGYRRFETGAFIAAPLLREGQLVGVLNVHNIAPRPWATDEIALVEDVAERLWLALQRVEAQQALLESEERLRIALEAGRMGTWRYDMRTGVQQWSRRQFEIFGLDPDGEPPTRALFISMVHPDDLTMVEFTADDVRPEGTFLDTEFRIRRPDGEIRHLVAHALARFDEDGRPCEIIGINQDVTEQRRIERAQRDGESLFRSFADASSDVLWIRGVDDMQWQYLSPAFEALYGLTREEASTGDNLQSWANLIVPEDRERALEYMARARTGEHTSFEYRIMRQDGGGIRWLRSTTFPMRDDSGRLQRIGGIGHDLTELKAAEAHQRLLLSELQHRVRNTLAVIRAIARRTLRTADNVENYASHLEGRIDAFARVQAAVTRNPVNGLDLAAMIAEELRAHLAREGDTLTIEGPPVRLKAKPAETIALAIHELATNAIKYGALSVPSGRLDISWRLLPDNQPPALELEWRESGLDLSIAEEPRRGFGSEVLLRMLAYEFNATSSLDFLPQGVFCRIVLPVETVVQEAIPARSDG